MRGRRKRTAWERKGWVVPARRRRRTNIPAPQYRPEIKFHDEEVDAKSFSSTTWITMMPADDIISGVAQGDTESSRDGRVYYIHSVHLKMFINTEQTVDSVLPFNDLQGRVIIGIDTQSNGLVIAPNDVMDTSGTEDWLAFRNLKNSKRFRVLWDKQFTLRNPEQMVTVNSADLRRFHSPAITTPVYSFNRRFKKPIKVTCTGTDGTIASISDNSIFVIGTANTTTLALQYQSRIRFSG